MEMTRKRRGLVGDEGVDVGEGEGEGVESAGGGQGLSRERNVWWEGR